MARPRPLLEPLSPGWQRDLPGPNDRPEPASSPYTSQPPNHVDDVYMELPRSTLIGRGVVMWGGGAMLCVTVWFLLILGKDPVVLIDDLAFLPVAIACILLGTWSAGLPLRLDLTLPRDEPIRFNRLRRKVYVYRFHYCWWRPFNNALWYVKPAVYDWDDLRAEEVRVYVPTVSYNSGVVIAVVKPGTNEVIDRFPLSDGTQGGASYWNMAVAFMHQGPQALPKFTRPPRDWNNEDPGLNLARRFAPKVKWPEAMDIESRTAP